LPHSIISIQEVAGLLGMDQRQAERMAQRGQIPCQKVGGQLRFNRAEITEWLQQHMITVKSLHLANMDAGITAHRQIVPDQVLVSSLLRVEAVSPSLPARTKNSVLRELVALAQATELLWDEETLLEALIEREELCSTALGEGLAIPHPRRPLPYAVAEPILAVAHTSGGIGYGAPDGRLTDLFFMICSRDDHYHLHIMARLCRMLHDESYRQSLRQAESAEKIIEIMQEREEEVMAE
jgi:PTS system nitrogen regulatory IIA component